MSMNETQTLTITIHRGRLLFSDAHGNDAYGVDTDGPIRGRGLLWLELADGTQRVIPSEEYRNVVG